MHEKVDKVIETFKALRTSVAHLPEPMSQVIAKEYNHDPYLLLISCLLSLRARDKKTLPISRKLFSLVRTPRELLVMPEKELEAIIHPIGFYHQKTRQLRSVSQELLERFNGEVPKTRTDLLSIKGVGPKTTSLVLAMAFGTPAICVDVHVHRLANMLGWVHTRTPEETERELEGIFPKRYWIEVNTVLVKVGQHISDIMPTLPRSIQKKLLPLVPKSKKPLKP